MYFSAKLSNLVKRKAIKLFYFRNVVSRIDVFLNCQFREVDGDDGGTERSGSGATPFRTFDLGWLVGVDGGTRAELCGATPFRTLDLGWRLGTMVVRSEAAAERHLSEFST